MHRPHRLATVVAAAIGLALVSVHTLVGAQAGATLPDRLTDTEFWALTQGLSEPDGTMTTEFQSDNLVSNEAGLQKVLPALINRHPAGGVYLGVGPEQNFTYISALGPRIAFIVDLRRGNRDLHLMYKALFELAADRADFVSLLFSRARPEGLSAASSAAEIFSAFDTAEGTDARFRANLERIIGRLVTTHGWPLSDDERRGIEHVYGNFFRHGPRITYGSSRSATSASASTGLMIRGGTYASLMQATDANGEPRGYLSSEARFAAVKDLQSRNLIVPVVGNFSGPKALRAVGDWLRARRATVSAFYLSNVEDYLQRAGTWTTFCQNAGTLPVDDASSFIRSGGRARPVASSGNATSAPAVLGFSVKTRLWADGTPGPITVMFSDGTSRKVTEAELTLMLPNRGGLPDNALGSISTETAACGGAGLSPAPYFPVTPNNSR